ncbi:hypothetical protein ACMBCM_10450, partial [Spiroplasma sp. K1]
IDELSFVWLWKWTWIDRGYIYIYIYIYIIQERKLWIIFQRYYKNLHTVFFLGRILHTVCWSENKGRIF